MLKKENRLKTRFVFNLTYQNQNVVFSPIMILYAGRLKQDQNCPTRVGFVVSKKVHKRACIRNRIKRLMREVIRLKFKNNDTQIIDKYQSLIFVARNAIFGSTLQDIENTIKIL